MLVDQSCKTFQVIGVCEDFFHLLAWYSK